MVRYELKTPYLDGTTHVIFKPLAFISKLAALVPKPRANLTRYHGVFAPNSKHRALVTPGKGRQQRRDLVSTHFSKCCLMRQGFVHSQSRELPKNNNSQGTPCLLLAEEGRNGSVERIFEGFKRFFDWLIHLYFWEQGVYASYSRIIPKPGLRKHQFK
jgi:hypothetical protein